MNLYKFRCNCSTFPQALINDLIFVDFTLSISLEELQGYQNSGLHLLLLKTILLVTSSHKVKI